MKLVRLRRDEKGSGALLEAVLPRIERMCHRHSGDPTQLIGLIWGLYAQNSPALGLWAAVDDDGQVVGHLLATIQSWDYKPCGWIHQCETDERASRPIRDEVIASLESWLREWNEAIRGTATIPAKGLVFATGRDAEAWVRHAGFRIDRTILRREVVD